MEKTVGVEVVEIVAIEDAGSHSHSPGHTSRKHKDIDANNFLVVIQIWTSDGHRYTVSRTYKAFVNLQAQLTRKYPRSKIPALPRAVDIATNKKSSLSEYISGLMQIPEILQADTLLSFLDEETNGEGDCLDFDCLHKENTSCIDLLLEHETEFKKVVAAGRELEVPLEVESESVVVWKFSTQHRDIGFSVQYNGTEVIKYQRLESQNKAITGLFEVPSSAIDADGRPCALHSLVLKFDNSYSKLRSKGLTYSYCLASEQDYKDALESAVICNRRKTEFYAQRQLVRAGLAAMSRRIIVQSGNSTMAMLAGSSPAMGIAGLGGGGLGSGPSLDGSSSSTGSSSSSLSLSLSLGSAGGGAVGTLTGAGDASPMSGAGGGGGGGGFPSWQAQAQSASASASGMSIIGTDALLPLTGDRGTHRQFSSMGMGMGMGMGGVGGGGGVVTSQQYQQLLDEKSGLVRAYEEALGALEDERTATAAAVSRGEKTLSRIEALEDELAQAREEHAVYKQLTAGKDAVHENVLDDIQRSQRVAMEAIEKGKAQFDDICRMQRVIAEQHERISSLQQEVAQAAEADAAAQEALRVSKAEKKQLKKYGIQAKADLERLTQENARLEAEVAALQTEVRIGSQDVLRMHGEMEVLRASLSTAVGAATPAAHMSASTAGGGGSGTTQRTHLTMSRLGPGSAEGSTQRDQDRGRRDAGSGSGEGSATDSVTDTDAAVGVAVGAGDGDGDRQLDQQVAGLTCSDDMSTRGGIEESSAALAEQEQQQQQQQQAAANPGHGGDATAPVPPPAIASPSPSPSPAAVSRNGTRGLNGAITAKSGYADPPPLFPTHSIAAAATTAAVSNAAAARNESFLGF